MLGKKIIEPPSGKDYLTGDYEEKSVNMIFYDKNGR